MQVSSSAMYNPLAMFFVLNSGCSWRFGGYSAVHRPNFFPPCQVRVSLRFNKNVPHSLALLRSSRLALSASLSSLRAPNRELQLSLGTHYRKLSGCRQTENKNIQKPRPLSSFWHRSSPSRLCSHSGSCSGTPRKRNKHQ